MGGVGAKSQTAKNKEKANKTQNAKTKSGGAGGGSSKGAITTAELDNYNLSVKEMRNIQAINEKNNWSITNAQLRGLSTQYKNAAKKRDLHKLALIEERLTDINHHQAVRDLRKKAGIKDSNILGRGVQRVGNQYYEIEFRRET